MHGGAPLASVAVVGGGLAGAAFALHLLRDAPHLPMRISVIEPRPLLGAGLAYATADAQHRINVAASRMSLFAEDPAHFDRWLRATCDAGDDRVGAMPDGARFPCRALFGRYLDGLLRQAAAAAFPARLEHVRDRAVAAAAEGEGYRVTLAGGGLRTADVLVLATGHPPAALPAPLAGLAGDQRLIADPWTPALAERVRPQDRVLILGTGLTMLDVLASLQAAGHRGPVVALSRRGLLPRPRTPLPVEPEGDFLPAGPGRVGETFQQFRAAVRQARAAGRPWEDCFDRLRAEAQAIWATLPEAERRRFLRHLQPFWDVHRYQCAPQVQAVLQRRQAEGRLTVRAATLLGAERLGETLRVQARPRGRPAGEVLQLACDVAINCTGPGHARGFICNPLLSSLAAARLLRPDPLGLGLAVDTEGRAIDFAGRAQPRLRVVGPAARGAYGELMGLPQVSAQPRAVAAAVAAALAGLLAARAPAPALSPVEELTA